MTLGLHLALTATDERRLLAAAEEERPDLVSEEFEENYPSEWTCESDKSWDAIHRAFNGGDLDYEFHEPLQGVVFGGEPLTSGEGYLISYKTAAQVARVSNALNDLTEQDFRRRYFAIDPRKYGFDLSEEDFEYSLENLNDLRSFYARAASASRCVIFTVSQ